MGRYATVDDIRARGIASGQADDNAVKAALDRATIAIDIFCRRDFDAHQRTYKVDGSGKESVFLDDRPIISISEIKIDDVLIAANTYALYREAGYVRLISYTDVWPRPSRGAFTGGVQNISITGMFGFLEVPPEVKEAAILLTIYFIGKAAAEAGGGGGSSDVGVENAIGIKSVKIDDLSVSFQYPSSAAAAATRGGWRTTGVNEADRLLVQHRREVEPTVL